MKTIMYFLFFTLCLLSCQKESTACERLPGKWRCVSYLADQTELMGMYVDYNIIQFYKLQSEEAEYDWTVKTIDGDAHVMDGIYSIKGDCEQLNLCPDDFPAGSCVDMSFSFSGDQLEISGYNAGFYQTMIFEKE